MTDLFSIQSGGAPVPPFCVFSVPGVPVPKGRPRFRVVAAAGKRPFAQVYSPPDTVAYEDRVAWLAKAAMRSRGPVTGPVGVRIFAMLPVPASWPARKREAALAGTMLPSGRPDWDNYAKAACDAMSGIVFVDDGQIARALVVKEFGDKPGLIIEVYLL